MKRFKKIWRLCGLVFFLLLAVGGVSLTGVAPNRRVMNSETMIEMVAKDEEEQESPADEAFY
jgi:hypothetical protein